MRTTRTIFSGRPFVVVVVFALLLGAAQTTSVGLRLGRQVRPHLGHGVAEGNEPNGLYGFFGKYGSVVLSMASREIDKQFQ